MEWEMGVVGLVSKMEHDSDDACAILCASVAWLDHFPFDYSHDGRGGP
jgi:hypothetical protein